MTTAAPKDTLQLLDLSSIEADPNNPRKDFPKEALQSLSHSIVERGVQSPIKVRPVGNGKFRVVFGERRFRASKLAGLEKIPAFVENLTDIQAADLQLAENIDREQLAPLEVAGGYQRQLELGVPMDRLCEKAGRKRSAVYATLALLKLSPDAKKALGEERIAASVAQLVGKYVPHASQGGEVSQLEGMSYRDAERYLMQKFGQLDLKKAPFDVKDEKLAPKAGSCVKCPKRSGNNTDLYAEQKGPDCCNDRACFFAKLAAHHKAAVEAKGFRMLPTDSMEAVFWEHSNQVRPDSGYAQPRDRYYEDAKQRPLAELLEPEQLKKLTVVAINFAGQPVELLERKNLAKELKKAGRVTSFQQLKKEQDKRAKTKATKAGEPVEKGPRPDELARDVLVGKVVAAVEDKGMLTSGMLRIIARALFQKVNLEGRIAERRKLVDCYALSDSKAFDKAFPKLIPGKLAGLVFELALDDAFEVGSLDDLDVLAGDACEQAHVDPAKVEAEVLKQLEAKKFTERVKEDEERVKAFKADVKKSTTKVGKKAA